MKMVHFLLLLLALIQCVAPDTTIKPPQDVPLCSSLSADQLSCAFNASCHYGDPIQVACRPFVPCMDSNQIKNVTQFRKAVCRYCHQITKETDITCAPPNEDCSQPGVARSFYVAKCRVQPWKVCMGRREFYRMRVCTRDSGKKYTTTVVLSLLFGGLGADRFYLGMWREGLGKLFTFGGLGVWSVVDFFLIAIGYISPRDDGSYWTTVPSE